MIEDRGVCVLCSDSGQVVVPHPEHVKRGEWITIGKSRPTAAVLCTCRIGERVSDAQRGAGLGKQGRGLQMTLRQYELGIPRELWQWFMARRYSVEPAKAG